MKRIIIVDDDRGVQEAFRFVFDPSLYDVTIYSNGNLILENAGSLPDLFILDKQLSGIDGLELCRILKSSPASAHIPIIMLSASPYSLNMVLQAGADAALEKPFSIKHLREVTEELLRK